MVEPSDLSDKERQIAAAALRVFSRYGLKRTTMNDVADEAGVVRQTLYNVFANKDEVIHGTVLFYCESLRNTVRSAWQDTDDLLIRFDLFCTHYIIASWDAVQATPDAGDLESGGSRAAKAAMEIAQTKVEDMFTALFTPHADALARNGQDLDRFIPFLTSALFGLKHGATDRDTLLRHLEALRNLVALAIR